MAPHPAIAGEARRGACHRADGIPIRGRIDEHKRTPVAQERNHRFFVYETEHLIVIDAIAVPQLVVVHEVAAMEFIEVGHTFICQPEGMEQFFEGLAAVGFKIPKGMVQVEEKVFILHALS